MAPSDTVLDAYWQTPPMARYAFITLLLNTSTLLTHILRNFATIAFTLSIAVYFGGVPWDWFFHHPYYLWQIPPQIWRLVTTFLVTAPGLGILFDTYFLYRYLSDLEVGHPRFPRKEDVLWYLMFVGGTILVSRNENACPKTSSLHDCFVHPSNICPDSAIASTAITVPGIEEDYPCTSSNPHIRNLGLLAVWAWWDV